MEKVSISSLSSEGVKFSQGTAKGQALSLAKSVRGGALAIFFATATIASMSHDANAMGLSQQIQNNQERSAAASSQGKTFAESWSALKGAAGKAKDKVVDVGGSIKDKAVDTGTNIKEKVTSPASDSVNQESAENGSEAFGLLKKVGKIAVGIVAPPVGLAIAAGEAVKDHQSSSKESDNGDLNGKLNTVREKNKSKQPELK